MDRRIEKSKKAIIDSLTQLMEEKDFDKITINEIANRANVNRGTVYLHYVDKFDLLNHCIETHLNELFQTCIVQEDIEKPSSKAAMLSIFEHLEQHAFFYSNMLSNKGTPTFRSCLFSMIMQLTEKQVDKKNINKKLNKEVIVQYVASATLGVIEWWLTHSMPYPPKDMVDQLWLLLEQVQLVH